MSRNQSLIQRDCYWPAQNFHYLPECIYIGDHIRDIQAGRSAGANHAAGWGYIDESENIAEWQADWIIEEPQDLNQLLLSKVTRPIKMAKKQNN